MGAALGVLGILGYALWIAGGALMRDGNWIGVDFQVYYQAAKSLARGENIYTAGISPPYVYPPLLAALVTPLAGLAITPATIFWKVLQHISLLIAGVGLTALSPRGVRPLVGGVLLASLLLVPVRDEIRVGESNSLILALVVGSTFFAARTLGRAEAGCRDTPAAVGGALLALAVGIKVLPVLVLAYFWWRGPRALALWGTAIFVGLQLVTLALTPQNTIHYWLVEFPGLFGQAFPFLDNQSLNATFSRALLPGDPSYPPTQIAEGEALRPVLTWAANLLVLGAAVWVLARVTRRADAPSGERRVRLLLEVGLVLLTTHLVSGSTWVHHLVALGVPVAGLIGAWWVQGAGRGWVPLAAGLGLAGAALAREPEEWVLWADSLAPGTPALALLASSLPMFAVIGLWMGVAFALRRWDGRAGSVPSPPA
jgi:hypothetical protein